MQGLTIRRLDQDLTDPRLCAAIVDRLTFGGNIIIETGTDSYCLAHTRPATPRCHGLMSCPLEAALVQVCELHGAASVRGDEFSLPARSIPATAQPPLVEQPMATVHAGMTMSLDGFVADRNGNTARLSDPAALRGSEYTTALIQATGAVVMGKRTFAMAEDPDWFVGNYEFQVPIFVLTHTPPPVMPKQDEHLTFTFVTDGVESAIAKAKAAAGQRVVQVLGASVVQQVLRAGLADELHVDVAPVLLGAGLRLFDDPDLEGSPSRRSVCRRSGRSPRSASWSSSSSTSTRRAQVRPSARSASMDTTAALPGAEAETGHPTPPSCPIQTDPRPHLTASPPP